MSSPFTIGFSEKCIITTRGNCGIGLGYSHALATADARVNSADAPKVAQELQDKYKIKVQAYKRDVTNAERGVGVFVHIDKDIGPVTGLNAGMKSSLDLITEDFSFVNGTNVLGVFNSAVTVAKLNNLSIVITSFTLNDEKTAGAQPDCL
ncbi:hypothetical protein BD769DRAFT_1780028 [Suillus cothurnatus]|nr:hypothetical protein BD769DRAFT_1780028 [Suillus cothurnatus]